MDLWRWRVLSGDKDETALATRLDELFRRCRPGGSRWTNDQVSAEVKKINSNVRVSGAYLSALRTGKRTRPSPELLAALAKFFGVSPAYFFDPHRADHISQQLAVLDQMSQAGVRAVALRAIGLPTEALGAMATVLDQMRKAQGLPPVEEKAECYDSNS
jgi:transcriptional regulator with XRE-family HTH domain